MGSGEERRDPMGLPAKQGSGKRVKLATALVLIVMLGLAPELEAQSVSAAEREALVQRVSIVVAGPRTWTRSSDG